MESFELSMGRGEQVIGNEGVILEKLRELTLRYGGLEVSDENIVEVKRAVRAFGAIRTGVEKTYGEFRRMYIVPRELQAKGKRDKLLRAIEEAQSVLKGAVEGYKERRHGELRRIYEEYYLESIGKMHVDVSFGRSADELMGFFREEKWYYNETVKEEDVIEDIENKVRVIASEVNALRTQRDADALLKMYEEGMSFSECMNVAVHISDACKDDGYEINEYEINEKNVINGKWLEKDKGKYTIEVDGDVLGFLDANGKGYKIIG